MKEYGLDHSDYYKFLMKHGMTDKGFSQDKAFYSIMNVSAESELIPMPRLIVKEAPQKETV